jgi:hypothetical protein
MKIIIVLLFTISFNIKAKIIGEGGVGIASIDKDYFYDNSQKNTSFSRFKVLSVKDDGVSFLVEDKDFNYTIQFIRDEDLNEEQLILIDRYIENKIKDNYSTHPEAS